MQYRNKFIFIYIYLNHLWSAILGGEAFRKTTYLLMLTLDEWSLYIAESLSNEDMGHLF